MIVQVAGPYHPCLTQEEASSWELGLSPGPHIQRVEMGGGDRSRVGVSHYGKPGGHEISLSRSTFVEEQLCEMCK